MKIIKILMNIVTDASGEKIVLWRSGYKLWINHTHWCSAGLIIKFFIDLFINDFNTYLDRAVNIKWIIVFYFFNKNIFNLPRNSPDYN